MAELIEINAYPVKNVLRKLLQDKTTGKNIIFATDGYTRYGCYDTDQITEGALLGFASLDIQPRVMKDRTEQSERTRKKAEVFTPTWIVKKMNDHCDIVWREDKYADDWQKYISLRILEITCGEAPFLVTRYDTTTGEPLLISERTGILDRKLQAIQANDEKTWLKWAYKAYESTYGYEFQGDNLLIARINLLVTFCDYLNERWHRQASDSELKHLTNIIVWNLWQMDGLNDTVPLGVPGEEFHQFSLFGDEEPVDLEADSCKIYNHRSSNSLLFADIKEGKSNMKFDFVIGNPPYQEESDIITTTNGQKPRKNIFHHFQIAADEITNGGSVLIYPGGRWLHQSGKGIKEFGKSQINDTRLKSVIFYPESKVVFGKSADLSDGITIVIKSQSKTTGGFQYSYMTDLDIGITVDVDNPGDDLLPLNPNDLLVSSKIRKFVEKYKLCYLHDSILPRSLFSIESDFVEKNPSKAVLYTEGMEINYAKSVKLLTNDRAGKAGRARWFVVDISEIKQNREYINQWQVIVSSANAGGQKRDNQIAIADNHSAFGRSRVALRSFDTYEEALNFYNYCRTYVIRYAFLITDEALSSLGKQVPDLMDYKENTIIDFSRNIDEQLFQLLELTDDEITYMKHRIDHLRSKEGK